MAIRRTLPPEVAQRLQVFLPGLYRRTVEAIASGQRFVHYTAAPAAMSLIRNREIWLRNTQCMNDFSEVRHGLELLRDAYRGRAGQRLLDFLDEVHPGLRATARERFEELGRTIGLETYIACVSEHDASEDRIGRLSMWRAYSGACGVALVLRSDPLFGTESNALGVFTGPVRYADRPAFLAGFDDFAARLEAERDYVAELGREGTVESLVGSYYAAALSTKHPGFAEEREWRVAFNPRLQGDARLARGVEVCRGEPQIVYRLPIRNDPAAGVERMGFDEMLERLIIGPSENPRAVRDAFVELLAEAGVRDPAARVLVSDIPVR